MSSKKYSHLKMKSLKDESYPLDCGVFFNR